MSQRRPLLVSAGLALSMALLVPGLVLPVLSVRGELQPAGLAPLVPSIVEAGLTPEALATIRPLMNPVALAVIELSPGGLQGALADRLSPQIIAGLSRSEPIDVYAQTRSILGAVRHLYAVGSPTAATLILLFSVIVPVAKIGLVLAAMAAHDEGRRQRTLGFVEVIAKWSMADVFWPPRRARRFPASTRRRRPSSRQPLARASTGLPAIASRPSPSSRRPHDAGSRRRVAGRSPAGHSCHLGARASVTCRASRRCPPAHGPTEGTAEDIPLSSLSLCRLRGYVLDRWRSAADRIGPALANGLPAARSGKGLAR
jgi:hypothetical protein